jgi:hypothetical protein
LLAQVKGRRCAPTNREAAVTLRRPCVRRLAGAKGSSSPHPTADRVRPPHATERKAQGLDDVQRGHERPGEQTQGGTRGRRTPTQVALTTADIEPLLPVLGFKNNAGEWSAKRAGYVIKIVAAPAGPTQMRADFGPKIKIGHKGIQNLANPENLVVVDAVLQLLDRGYKPEQLELEPKWKLGHGEKGRLDILVRRPTKRAYAMVECKSWGTEYAKERNNLLEDGGQLFSYFVQDQNAEGLYLYSAKIGPDIARQVEFLETKKLNGKNKDELFASWDQQLFADGLFRAGSLPYAAEYRPLLRGDLKQLDHESGRGLFNSFAEVLRRNVLSDKTNAFNKIFNLFVCKLQDEDAGDDPSDVLRFQWKPDDTPAEFLDRLTDLYRTGSRTTSGSRSTRRFTALYLNSRSLTCSIARLSTGTRRSCAKSSSCSRATRSATRRSTNSWATSSRCS